MLNKSFIFFICMFWFAVGNAEEQSLLTLKQAKPILSNYGNAIGCNAEDDSEATFSFLPDKNFVHFQLPDEIGDTYIAAIYLDIGCSGGTGSTVSRLVALEFRNGDYAAPINGIYVLPQYSEPNAIVQKAPSMITSLYTKDGKLQATGLDSDDGTGKCPCTKTIYRIELSSKKTGIVRNRPADSEEEQEVYLWRFTEIGTYGVQD